MDSAEAEWLTEILRAQESHLARQEEFQTAMAANIGHLSSQLQDLLGQLARPVLAAQPPTTTATPALTSPPPGAGCKLASPAPYTGAPSLCKTFLIDCSIHFELMPHTFPTDRSKIAFMISHLTDRTTRSAEWGRGSPLCDSFTDFQAALTKTFDPVSSSRKKGTGTEQSEAGQRLRVQKAGEMPRRSMTCFWRGSQLPYRTSSFPCTYPMTQTPSLHSPSGQTTCFFSSNDSEAGTGCCRETTRPSASSWPTT